MGEGMGVRLVGMSVFNAFAFWQDRNLARQIGESGRAYEQQKEQFARITAELSPEKREAQLDQDLKSIETAIALRRSLMGEFGKGGPAGPGGYSEYLRAFARQTVQGLWLTSIQIAEGGGQLTMSGRALQADLVPVLIGRLKQESVLQGAPHVALAITRGTAGKGPARPTGEVTVSTPQSCGPGIYPAAP